jgi:hypothetical protein
MPKVFAVAVFGILFVSPLFLVRRRPLWALLVPLTIGVTFVLSTEPRYYVMIMPVLLLGWVLAWRSVSVRLDYAF